MRRYKTSTKINPNNVFLVYNSELEGRLDPHFYKPEFRILQNKLESKPNSKLGNLIYYSNETWNQKDFFDSMFPYIEISSIDTTSGEIENVHSLAKEDAPSRAKKIVRENDIIVSTTRPNRGAIAFIEKEYDYHIASTGFSVLRNLKTDSISKEYLYLILHQTTSLKQMEQRCSGGNYPAITEDELRKIIIPTLDVKKRQIVIDTLQDAFKSKHQKEKQAKELLDSIDEYLLNELGIKIPEKDNSLPNRIFTTTFKKVSGNRFDPDLYTPYSYLFYSALNNGRYAKDSLKNIASNIFQGVSQNLTKNENITLLKVKNIRKNNIIDFEDVEFVETAPEIKILREGDIITPFIGEAIRQIKFSVFPKRSNKYTVDNNTGVIRLCERNNPYFVASILCSIIGKVQILAYIGGGVPFLGSNIVKSFQIPIPPLSTQNIIAGEVNKLRNDAKKLFEEANEELEKARQQVEKIILEEE